MYSLLLFLGWYFAHFYPYCYLGFSVNELHRNFLTHWTASTQSIAQRLLHFCSCEVSLQSQRKHHCNFATCWFKKRCCCKFRWNFPDVSIPYSNLHICEKVSGNMFNCRQERNMQKTHSEEKVKEIAAKSETSPRKVLVWYVQQNGVPASSA